MIRTFAASAPRPGTMLATYLSADPRRAPVYENIRALLDDTGQVGDLARFYIVRSAFRRAVFRGVSVSIGMNIPAWAYEKPDAASENKLFIAGYRAVYNEHRRQRRAVIHVG